MEASERYSQQLTTLVRKITGTSYTGNSYKVLSELMGIVPWDNPTFEALLPVDLLKEALKKAVDRMGTAKARAAKKLMELTQEADFVSSLEENDQ